MKKRINFDILKQNQRLVQSKNNPFQRLLYQKSYQLVVNLLQDIKVPFKKICIHGYYPQLMIQHLIRHEQNLQQKGIINKQNKQNSTKQLPSLTIIDYLDIIQQARIKNPFYSTKILKVQNSQQFPPEQQQFDLIISGLQLNHTNNQQTLLTKYLRTLKPDGALLGCAMVEGTLSQLNWAYLMAQNQRYGGISPKVLNFPGIGQLGSFLTSTHYTLTTVLNQNYQLEFESPLDLLKAIQQIGQSGHLKGRRKAIFKDLLISMYALYQSQYSIQDQTKILSSLILSPFIGWKFCQSQRKPLRRGNQVDSVGFIQELRKHDSQLEHYQISQGSQDAKEVLPSNKQHKHH